MKVEIKTADAWHAKLLDVITMSRSRKCPVCGGKIFVMSGGEVTSLYCDGCKESVMVAVMISEGCPGLTSFLALGDHMGMREV